MGMCFLSVKFVTSSLAYPQRKRYIIFYSTHIQCNHLHQICIMTQGLEPRAFKVYSYVVLTALDLTPYLIWLVKAL